MARHGRYSYCCVDGWLAEKVQTQLWILVIPVEQRALDRVGLARPRVRAHRSTGLPCVPEHPRRDEESHAGIELCLLTLLRRCTGGVVGFQSKLVDSLRAS